jgi:hypothetical protein
MRLAALARHIATVVGVAPPVTELHPYPCMTLGVPRRSSTEYAQTEQHARQLAAERFKVPVERVVIPQRYSLMAGDR